jgi:hypothetical protein
MTLAFHQPDPSTALFLSHDAAAGVGAKVLQQYAGRVKRVDVKARIDRGELLGYTAVAHFYNNRYPTAITNSDVDHITNGA